MVDYFDLIEGLRRCRYCCDECNKFPYAKYKDEDCLKGCLNKLLEDSIEALEPHEPTMWNINRMADKIYCPKCGASWNLYCYEEMVKKWAYCPKCGSVKTGVNEV